MDIIKMTRELGKAIQADERYTEYYKAKKIYENDEELQNLIGEFNIKRANLNMEISKPDKDDEKLKELDSAIKELYAQIMANPSMVAFNNAKNNMDNMLTQINTVITMCANGEDPDTCPVSMGCSPDGCASCNGCH